MASTVTQNGFATSLEDRVAVVTGAARGIGLAICEALASAGARIAMVDLQNEVMASAEQLTRDGFVAQPFLSDVSRKADVDRVAGAILRHYGRIDILVNNAGICPTTPLAEIAEEEWDRVLAVNLKGAFLWAQAVAPVMQAQGGGRIINVASAAGQMGGIAVGLHYSASKAGVIGLTKGLARILAPAIQVNAVSPGTTESEMTRGWEAETIAALTRQIPLKRLGHPADTAAAVLFLASDAASFITGQTLSVNGGLFMG
jgi:3-oxoacyl-[acyl-carrier protein] reductase